MNTVEQYPLSWPYGMPRTVSKKRSPFKAVALSTIARARDGLIAELRLLKASEVIISTNLRIRKDGMIIGEQSQPKDPGVAVFFKWQKAPRTMACDRWNRVEDNLYALTLSIQAMRGLDRWGATDIMQNAFQGFTALPAPGKPWWEVLGCRREVDMDDVQQAFRQKARRAHPDAGGSTEAMVELNKAVEQAIQEKGAHL